MSNRSNQSTDENSDLGQIPRQMPATDKVKKDDEMREADVANGENPDE
jgi:hypothetical protein